MSAPTITVETRTEALRRVISAPAQGWEFSIWEDQADSQPRVRDIDAATRLGYARPRDVRKTIERIWPEDKRPSCRAAVAHQLVGPGGKGTRTYTVQEYWLTEAELLKLCARAETPIAEAILDEMIAVYMAVRRHLVATVPVKAHERKPPQLTPSQRFLPPAGVQFRPPTGDLPPPAPKPQLPAPAPKPQGQYIIELNGTSVRVSQVIAEHTPRDPASAWANRALVEVILSSLGIAGASRPA